MNGDGIPSWYLSSATMLSNHHTLTMAESLFTILHGSKVPLVLRPLPSLHVIEYQLVGDCYFQGIMHSAAVSRLRERGELESWTQPFSLR